MSNDSFAFSDDDDQVYELSGRRYIGVRCGAERDIFIVIRDYINPQQRAEFTGTRWATFVEWFDVTDGYTSNHHIGGGWYVSSALGTGIEIRKWACTGDEPMPTEIGIVLLPSEYSTLRDIHHRMDVEIPALSMYEACFHQGQLDWLRCCECNAFDFGGWH